MLPMFPLAFTTSKAIRPSWEVMLPMFPAVAVTTLPLMSPSAEMFPTLPPMNTSAFGPGCPPWMAMTPLMVQVPPILMVTMVPGLMNAAVLLLPPMNPAIEVTLPTAPLAIAEVPTMLRFAVMFPILVAAVEVLPPRTTPSSPPWRTVTFPIGPPAASNCELVIDATEVIFPMPPAPERKTLLTMPLVTVAEVALLATVPMLPAAVSAALLKNPAVTFPIFPATALTWPLKGVAACDRTMLPIFPARASTVPVKAVPLLMMMLPMPAVVDSRTPVKFPFTLTAPKLAACTLPRSDPVSENPVMAPPAVTFATKLSALNCPIAPLEVTLARMSLKNAVPSEETLIGASTSLYSALTELSAPPMVIDPLRLLLERTSERPWRMRESTPPVTLIFPKSIFETGSFSNPVRNWVSPISTEIPPWSAWETPWTVFEPMPTLPVMSMFPKSAPFIVMPRRSVVA